MAFNSLKAAMMNAVCWTKLSTEREDAEVTKIIMCGGNVNQSIKNVHGKLNHTIKHSLHYWKSALHYGSYL